MLSEREKDCVNSDNNYIEEEKKRMGRWKKEVLKHNFLSKHRRCLDTVHSTFFFSILLFRK